MARRVLLAICAAVWVLAASGIGLPSAGASQNFPILSPSPIDFGPVIVGHTRTTTFSIRWDTVEAVALVSSDNPAVTATAGNCGLLTTCSLRVGFTPPATGTLTAHLTVYGCGLVPCTGFTTVPVTVTGTGVTGVTSKTGPYWRGFKIPHGVALTSFGDSGYIVDGWGGIHTFSKPGVPEPGLPHGQPYTAGKDVIRGIALLSDNTGGYEVDLHGFLHPFGIGASPAPPSAFAGFFSFDAARGVTLTDDGLGGYVVDLYGGIHPFAIGSTLPVQKLTGPYWRGRDLVRGMTLSNPEGGYVLDAFGGVHTAKAGPYFAPPPAHGGPYWKGWDITRGIDYDQARRLLTIVDAYGGLHTASTA